MSVGDRYLDHVWIVNRLNEVDGLYVFEDEERAVDFAARYGDAVVTEEVVMNDSAAAQFLIDTADDDDHDDGCDCADCYHRINGHDPLEIDHSMAKEDRRNAGIQ